MNILATMRKYNKKSTFVVQVTSMCDMMTILLAFLLNSQSMSATQISPIEGLDLPQSMTAGEPVEALKLVVTRNGIFVNDTKVADIADGRLPASVVDAKDKMFIPALYEVLDKEAENSKKISQVNETLEFDGKVVLLADARLNYEVLKQVMYTATSAGFANVRLASLSIGD